MRGNIDVVRYLVKDGGVNANKEDIFGNTPLSNARKLRSQDIIDIIVEWDGVHVRDIGTDVQDLETDPNSSNRNLKFFY